MGLKCKIVYRDGQALALNDNGQISPLYLEALGLYKDEKRALNIWAVSQSEDFQDAFGITSEEAILTDVVEYLDTKSFVDKRMSSSDKIQVKAFMVKNGFESLSDFNSALSSIFKEKGFFQFDEQKMIDSGLWKPSELPYARTQRKEIQALLSRIEGELITEDITVATDNNATTYRDSNNKTIFGTSEIIDETEISRAIKNLINNFQDSEEFYAKIKELPFEEFVAQFYSNDKFAKELINRYKQIKKVPVLSFVNGELSADNNETYTTLKNTILSNVNSISIEADLSFLQGISPKIWNTTQGAIKDILKEVEQSTATLNIDVVGLNNYSNQQENIIDLLSSLNRMIQSPTEKNIQEFSQKKDNLIAPEDNTIITETLPENLMNLNIVRLDSIKTDNELFAEHGLIKVGDNLYHKVQRGQITELYDYLYNQVVDGTLDIPIKTQDKTDKPAILKEIAEFVNARNTGIVSEFQEEISLNQLAFEHPAIAQENVQKDISQLSIITQDTDYLKTGFISDFYAYILEEKLKNSELYRDVLSHFTINDRDISLQGTKTPNIEGVKYEQELRDYARLKRDSSLKQYVEGFNTGMSEDLYALNFPDKLPTYRGEIVTDGEFAILNKTNRTFVKFNNKLYRNVGENLKVSIFQEIKTSPNTVYYTTNLNFTTDIEVVERVMERYPEGLSVQTLTYEQKQENLKKARMTESVPHKKVIRDKEKLFTNNLVEFVKQKGVQVITDPEQIQAELETSMPMIALNDKFKTKSKTIDITPNKIVVRFDKYAKIKTRDQAFKANQGIRNKVEKMLKKELGKNYSPKFISTNDFDFYSETNINIPQSVYDKMEMDAIEQERLIKAVETETEKYIDEEQLRGVDEESLRDMGFNFLQTPAGNVLGFEKNGIIYLDEEQLNDITTLHELNHVYQSILDIRASKGDEVAQKIIAKREELFQSDVDFWKVVHSGKVGVGEDINSEDTNYQLETALEQSKEIELVKDDNGNLLSPSGAISNLNEVQWKLVRTEEFKNWFGDWGTNTENASKVVDENGEPLVVYHGADSKFSEFSNEVPTRFHRDSAVPGGFWFTTNIDNAKLFGSSVFTTFLNVRNPVDVDIQNKDSVKKIVSPDEGIKAVTEEWWKYNKGEVQHSELKRGIELRIRENENTDGVIYRNFKDRLLSDNFQVFNPNQIKSATGENTTFDIQSNNINFSTEINSQLKDTIGLDLSSPVYAQRPNETDVDWNTRLLKEVEAYITAPGVAQQLEELQKSNPSLWEQITNFINQLKNWLKSQIGLTDYQGDIMDMTKEEYVNALGVSILKDEYTVLPTYEQLQDKYNSIAPFKNGEIEIIYHHTEAQHEEIMNKIDECGS